MDNVLKLHENIQANLLHDFGDMPGYFLKGVSLGPDNEICALFVNRHPKFLTKYFLPSRANYNMTYIVKIVTKSGVREVVIPNTDWSFHFVQPIDSNTFLLAAARACYNDKNDYERNGKIYVIDDNNIWFYYLSAFDLVRIQDEG